MNSPSAVVCREIFDDNSQPSAEEISDYAQQLGIDPESESHLLPLAKDGLMQALPSPWKAYFDEKIQTHYYYNEETKRTQWEHPLDNVYRELVKKARDASIFDDTCASVQDLPTSEEATKYLERVETKVESDEDDLISDSDRNEAKDMPNKRIAPIGRPPLAPLSRHDKKLADLQLISPLRRSVDSPISKNLMRNLSERELLGRLERPKIFKQQSEIIDLKMHVKSDEDCFSPLLSGTMVEKGLPLTGKGNMFFKLSKSDLPSPDTEKSLPLDSLTKSDPPKSILREKLSDALQKKSESVVVGKSRQTFSFEEDKKSVRFKLETLPDPTLSPGSNSSSEINDGQSSIISATPVPMQSSPMTSLNEVSASKGLTSSKPAILNFSSPQSAILNVTSPKSSLGELRGPIVLSPLVGRPPLPPRSIEVKDRSVSDKESNDTNSISSFGASPMRRVVRPPASDYIKPDLFQKNFQKISDLVRPGDIDTSPVHLDEPDKDKEPRPRSPMIPQKNKISINLMESIESETSIDSPDREFANLDLNDLDESNELERDKEFELDNDKESDSDKSTNLKPSKPDIKVPKLEFLKQHKLQHSDSDDSKKSKQEEKSKSESFNLKEKPIVKITPSPNITPELRSPRDGKFNLFKPLSKVSVQKSDLNTSLVKSLNSPRLDGVILSQGKSTDNIVVVYQFESQDEVVPIKSPVPDMGTRDFIERNKSDEKRRLELSLQKELEGIRVEWSGREKRLKEELQEELRMLEEKFNVEKEMRLSEQAERHQQEIEEVVSQAQNHHQESIHSTLSELNQRYQRETQSAERQHADRMSKLIDEYGAQLKRKREELEIENERAISDIREQLRSALERERQRMLEENRAIVEALREEHTCRINDLKTDYRAEVERLRAQHACHIQEVRTRLADERAKLAHEPKHRERELADKYNCLKHKYARLKHDVKMSIERRNKRREMSMTTGSETEKSNSHKQHNSDRCKELKETSTGAVNGARVRNHNPTIKYNDNETSYSDTNAAKSINNNIEIVVSADTSQTSAEKPSRPRRVAVAFREPPRKKRDRDRDNGATTDYQDSSDATTADEKPKEPINGHGRRRCFTRLKSASTSRLNYSPKRGEGWSSPLESLRQQLRKLDDLEDQFPDLACQPAYSLRYPFTELGAVATADTPELEFVRHRALVEREGMRRARAVLKTRRKALRDNRDEVAQRAPSEEREATELEVALHRARALLGEKEIRLRHIERALRKIADAHAPPPPAIQVSHVADEAESSDGSSNSEVVGQAAGGAVLRSLKALHADVRDIWRALDARRPLTASPETSSYNAATTSQTRMTLSAPEATKHDNSDNSLAEKARGLRAWLQTAP